MIILVETIIKLQETIFFDIYFPRNFIFQEKHFCGFAHFEMKNFARIHEFLANYSMKAKTPLGHIYDSTRISEESSLGHLDL